MDEYREITVPKSQVNHIGQGEFDNLLRDLHEILIDEYEIILNFDSENTKKYLIESLFDVCLINHPVEGYWVLKSHNIGRFALDEIIALNEDFIVHALTSLFRLPIHQSIEEKLQ